MFYVYRSLHRKKKNYVSSEEVRRRYAHPAPSQTRVRAPSEEREEEKKYANKSLVGWILKYKLLFFFTVHEIKKRWPRDFSRHILLKIFNRFERGVFTAHLLPNSADPSSNMRIEKKKLPFILNS